MTERVRELVPPPSTPPEKPAVRTDINVRSVALTVLSVAATMYVLNWAQEIFIPVVLSILISYALEPVVAAFTRARIPRTAAAGLVVVLGVGLMGYGAY